MARFLLLTLDAAGNWPPELELVRAIVDRGHDVGVISGEAHAAAVRDAGATFIPYRLAKFDAERRDELEVAMRLFYLNESFADELRVAVQDDQPDVVLIDQMVLAAIVEAERIGIRRVGLYHTVYGAARTDRPGRVLEGINELRARKHLDPLGNLQDLFERCEATVVFTWAEFDSIRPDQPANVHHVGPLACVQRPIEPYVLRDDGRPLVLVSYSTSFQEQVPVLQRVVDALEPLPIRVLLTLGPAVEAAQLRLPDNVIAERSVPHAAVLPRTDLVVTHAGHGTVMAAVTAGVPMVCTPMGRDQFDVARQVDRRALGRVVPMDATVDELRDVITATLEDDELRDRARAFASGLDLEAGLRKAVDVLEAMARR